MNVALLLPVSILLGVIGGLMGPFFINVNSRINVYRGKYLKTKWIKVVETMFMAFITASIFFWVPYWVKGEACPNKD